MIPYPYNPIHDGFSTEEPWCLVFCCFFSQVDFCARCHTMLQQLFEGRTETLGVSWGSDVQPFFEGLYIRAFPKMVGFPNNTHGFSY